MLKDKRSRNCVEAVERAADGDRLSEEVARAWEAFQAPPEEGTPQDEGLDSDEALRNLVCFTDPAACLSVAFETADGIGWEAAHRLQVTDPSGWSPACTEAWEQAKRAEWLMQANLLHCVIGNPVRTPFLDPSWLTVSIVGLAKATYEERTLPVGKFDPARLAVLADALEDAGCTNAAILDHLRGPGPHVRGCFPVDLLLGRD